MSSGQPRLHLKPLIASLVIAAFAIREMALLLIIVRGLPPGRRLRIFLFHPQVTRKSFWLAISLGFALTMLGELLNGLILRPIVRSWLSPRVDHTEVLFRLSAGEWVVDTIPARRQRGPWSWEPGSLVRTNLQVWFIPTAWDSEPWSIRMSDADDAALVPAPSLLWGFVRDLPEWLVCTPGSGPSAVFVMRDPKLVENWLRPDTDMPQRASAPDAA
jgi:hypothetical protein